MTASLQLLGRPAVIRDGVEVDGPRGYKAWGLLAFLLLAERPPSRQRLVSLLFERADDPRAALRWNLAELRRALAGVVEIVGDPVELRSAPGVAIDVRETSTILPDGELLEGLVFDGSPAFDTWLSVERQRLAADTRALAYRRAAELFGRGEARQAAAVAARAVELDPFNADVHAVLVAALVHVGDTAAARSHVDRAADLFRRELGIDLPQVIVAAVALPTTSPELSPAAVESLLEAADASLAAGAAAAGVDQLRRAAAGSGPGSPLEARAQLALGSALTHSAGGRGAEVVTLFHSALAGARRHCLAEVGAAACRELAFIAVQHGSRAESQHWLAQADAWSPDVAERARILGVHGMDLSDAGDYDAALAAFGESVELAQRAGHQRQALWSRTLASRVHVLRGDVVQAASTLDDVIEAVRRERWTAFAPLPLSLRAEAAVVLGDLDTARDLADQAWTLASELADQCWITATARVQILIARAEQADVSPWIRRGLDAEPWYRWFRAWLLDAAVTAEGDPDAAAAHASLLEELAHAGGMREFTVRALVHRARLDQSDRFEAARQLAADVPNHALERLVAVAAS